MEKLQIIPEAKISTAWLVAAGVGAIAAVAVIGVVTGVETGFFAHILPDLVNEPVYDPNISNQ